MAISSLSAFTCRPLLSLLPPLFRCIRRTHLFVVAAIETLDEPERLIDDKGLDSGVGEGNRKGLEWKKLNSKDLAISTSKIARPTRKILNGLKQRGYEVYLVGGCVRDLILKRTPKDFDIITSAELKEVVRAFSRCEIVGKWFRICHVYVGDTIVEVSSFSTSGWKFDGDFRNTIQGLIDCDDKDYVRTIIPASNSFQEDHALILQAIRIAACLGFCFSQETAHSLKTFASSILRLDKGRLLLEMNYMLAYGSAEASLRLLWKFGLLEILLPIQAAYFVRHGFRRRDRRSNMLLSLFSNMDKLLAPDRPCHSSLWVCILAFHKALSDQSRDPQVVAVFSLAVHNGGNMSEAVKIGRSINKLPDASFHELSEPRDRDSEALIDEVMDFAASVKGVLSTMTDKYYVSQAMTEFPQAPYSDLVFISLALYMRACRIFDCVGQGSEKGFVPKQVSKINYEFLALGRLQEVRHTFARIVFDTVYPLYLN